ncbi:hypothetical protein ACKGJN_07295 [Gillisia sp. Q332]
MNSKVCLDIKSPTEVHGKFSKNDLLNIPGDTGPVTNYISTDENGWQNSH